jgi:hypothetical protein
MSRLYEQSEGPYGITSFFTVLVVITLMLYTILYMSRGVVTSADMTTCVFVGFLFAVCYYCTGITWRDPKELTDGIPMRDL